MKRAHGRRRGRRGAASRAKEVCGFCLFSLPSSFISVLFPTSTLFFPVHQAGICLTGLSFLGPPRTRRGFVTEATRGPRFEPFCFVRQGTQNASSDRSGKLRCCQRSREGCCLLGQNWPPRHGPRPAAPGGAPGVLGPLARLEQPVGSRRRHSRLPRCEDALLLVFVSLLPSLPSKQEQMEPTGCAVWLPACGRARGLSHLDSPVAVQA